MTQPGNIDPDGIDPSGIDPDGIDPAGSAGRTVICSTASVDVTAVAAVISRARTVAASTASIVVTAVAAVVDRPLADNPFTTPLLAYNLALQDHDGNLDPHLVRFGERIARGPGKVG